MKPILMRHVEASNESFKAWKNGDPYSRIPWHYHPEFELTYIHRGRGTFFVGDKMIEYDHNEMTLLGPNLPHEWRSEIDKVPDYYTETISVHFLYNFLGDKIYELPEVHILNELLKKASRGIRVTDPQTKMIVKEKLMVLPETKGLERIIKLLQILQSISVSPGLTFLASNSYVYTFDSSQDHRINKVYEYVLKHFQQDISVADVADISNMTKTSFCRFFKERTNQPFVKYLNEIRVGYACKLLLEGNLSIGQIAYESGFGNVSNFNKQFKSVKDCTPSEYMNEFFEKKSRERAVQV